MEKLSDRPEKLTGFPSRVVLLKQRNGRLIMSAEDVWNVSLTAPEAKLYLTHMDNVAHASVTRFTMRGQLTAYGVSNYDMLEDGETVVY